MRGKGKAFKLAIEKQFPLLVNFAVMNSPSLDLKKIKKEVRIFVEALYGRKSFGGNLDALRPHLSASINRDLRFPPPTIDACDLHCPGVFTKY